MDSLEKLKRAIIAQVKANVPVQTVWATCTSVNLQEGTMEATRDGVEYFDVLLGLNNDITVPEVGSKVLLGLVENHTSATFLLLAERIAQRRINGNSYGGLVRADDVAQELIKLANDVNQLKAVFAAWVTVPNDGGAALKLAATSWSSQQLVAPTSQQIQNPKVQHG